MHQGGRSKTRPKERLVVLQGITKQEEKGILEYNFDPPLLIIGNGPKKILRSQVRGEINPQEKLPMILHKQQHLFSGSPITMMIPT